MKKLWLGCCILYVSSMVFSLEKDRTEEAFSRIYRIGEWGKDEEGRGISGVGSRVENAGQYLNMLQNFIVKKKIKSVVDFGCGDWELSRHIQWKGVNYFGYDVVKTVVQRNIKRYSSKNIHFIHTNGVTAKLRKADLFICKDVLQHLPNKAIVSVIAKLKKYKYCLITNDIVSNFPEIPMNSDVPFGGFRALDLTKKPFYLKGKKILTYTAGGTVKQVLLITNKLKTHH